MVIQQKDNSIRRYGWEKREGENTDGSIGKKDWILYVESIEQAIAIVQRIFLMNDFQLEAWQHYKEHSTPTINQERNAATLIWFNHVDSEKITQIAIAGISPYKDHFQFSISSLEVPELSDEETTSKES